MAASPARAQLVTDDVDRFWRAFEIGGRSGSASAFQQRYLDSASAGLRDFIGLRQLSATSLAQVAAAYPAYLDALHAWWRTAPGRPGDLGYFMGYRIAQAYYLKATDKAQAIRDLITVRDPAALLVQSGYAGSGPPIP